jgi:hypothetical protein
MAVARAGGSRDTAFIKLTPSALVVGRDWTIPERLAAPGVI